MSVASVLRTCDYDPTRDKSYQQTRLGRSVVDFLAWMQLGGAAERTLDQYERDLARGALMFPSKGIEDWGISELLHLAATFSDRQRRVRVAAWKSFFKWALKMELVDRNPCDKLPEIKAKPQKVIDVFSDVQIKMLTGLPIIDGALMQILFDAGLRKAEARGLRLRNFDGTHLKVLGKGDKERVIPATPALIHKLTELRVLEGIGPDDYLWYGRPGGGNVIARHFPIGESSYQNWWRRCIEEAGIEYRNPHTTRHTFATRYLRRGGRIEKLAMALGHASIRTTEIYTHMDTTDLDAEFAELFAADAVVQALEIHDELITDEA